MSEYYNSIDSIEESSEENQLKIVKAGQDLNEAGVQSPEVEGSGKEAKASGIDVASEYQANAKPPRQNETAQLESGEKERAPGKSADAAESKSQNRGVEYLKTIDQFLGMTEELDQDMSISEFVGKSIDGKKKELFKAMAAAVLVNKGIEVTQERVGQMSIEEVSAGAKEMGEQIRQNDGKEMSTQLGASMDMLKEVGTLMDVIKHEESKAAELGQVKPGVTGEDIAEKAEKKSEVKGMGDNVAGLDNPDKSPEEKEKSKEKETDINGTVKEQDKSLSINDISGPDVTPGMGMDGQDQGRGM